MLAPITTDWRPHRPRLNGSLARPTVAPPALKAGSSHPPHIPLTPAQHALSSLGPWPLGLGLRARERNDLRVVLEALFQAAFAEAVARRQAAVDQDRLAPGADDAGAWPLPRPGEDALGHRCTAAPHGISAPRHPCRGAPSAYLDGRLEYGPSVSGVWPRAPGGGPEQPRLVAGCLSAHALAARGGDGARATAISPPGAHRRSRREQRLAASRRRRHAIMSR